MSTPNFDSRYITPAGVDSKIAAQATIDISKYATKPLARTSFTGRSNGSFTVQDTGQTVTNTGSALLTIASGVLTHTNPGGTGAAGYAETNIAQRIGRIGVTFQIPDVSHTGTVALVAPLASWTSGGVGSSAAGCHFTITATAWAYQVFDGSTLITLVSGTIALIANTDYDLEITFDTNTARVLLPDGTVVTVTDSRIGASISNLGIIELFDTNATTVPAKVSALRIDGVQAAPFPASTVARLAAAAASPAVFSAAHADYDTTISGTVEIGGGNARVSVTVPSTGKLLARISSMLELQTTDNVYAYPQFTYDTGGNIQGATVSASRAVCFQRFTLEALVTGLTPGATGFITWYTAKVGSATALWHSGGLNGTGNTSAVPIK